jgi:hypothetical protein
MKGGMDCLILCGFIKKLICLKMIFYKSQSDNYPPLFSRIKTLLILVRVSCAFNPLCQSNKTVRQKPANSGMPLFLTYLANANQTGYKIDSG